MVTERCFKKSFQDSLEDIKERMKEKRNKQLAKVVTANKNLSTKVKGKILQNSCVVLKNVQLNNKALAQALESEKAKTRQAQDVILHLKRDYQALKFQMFMLQRKLKSQEEENSAESKLSALREIISKVTSNLMETADLLGPAHDLCFTSHSQRFNPSVPEERDKNNSTSCLHVSITSDNIGNKISENEMDNFTTVKYPDLLAAQSWQSSENFVSVQRGSRGRRAVIYQSMSDVSQNGDDKGSNLPKKASARHSNCNFKQHDEQWSLNTSESSTSVGLAREVGGQESTGRTEICIKEGDLGKVPVLEDMEEEVPFSPNENQINLDRLTLFHLTEVKSSTPEPKPIQSHVKDKGASQAGKERGRKGRTDGAHGVPLKKPWENKIPRARSKSRERGTNKQPSVKIRMDTSIGSCDAYDFLSEESVHLTPFRQGKTNDISITECEQSCSEQSSSEIESDDSLYVPHSKTSKRKSKESELNSGAPPSRPRSKRSAVLQKQQQQLLGEKQKNTKPKEWTENSIPNEKKNGKPVDLKIRLGNTSVDTGSEVGHIRLETVMKKTDTKLFLTSKMDEIKKKDGKSFPADLQATNTTVYMHKTRGNPLKAPQIQHFGLCDITNFSAVSDAKKVRKISCPLLDCDQENSTTPIRKRRCTFTVNYKEPTLSRKLRRGDRFTDTAFLHSPIFKQKDSKHKSYKKRSLTRYNEAFVDCC